jgi:hypothetical protein
MGTVIAVKEYHFSSCDNKSGGQHIHSSEFGMLSLLTLAIARGDTDKVK